MNWMKRILCLALLVVLLAALVGCKPWYQIYDEKDFIGLTSKQIEDKYGKFDHHHNLPGEDGIYRNTIVGYEVAEGEADAFGENKRPIYFLISLNAEGIAYKCEYTQCPLDFL